MFFFFVPIHSWILLNPRPHISHIIIKWTEWLGSTSRNRSNGSYLDVEEGLHFVRRSVQVWKFHHLFRWTTTILVESWNACFVNHFPFLRQICFTKRKNHAFIISIYVWIYENGAEKLNSQPKPAGVFFWPETISKVDDIKIKSKSQCFFLPLPVYLPFITLLFLLLPS